MGRHARCDGVRAPRRGGGRVVEGRIGRAGSREGRGRSGVDGRESARAVETVDEDLVLYRFAQTQHGEFVQRRTAFDHAGDDDAALAV